MEHAHLYAIREDLTSTPNLDPENAPTLLPAPSNLNKHFCLEFKSRSTLAKSRMPSRSRLHVGKCQMALKE
jgi:hypothetical protein